MQLFFCLTNAISFRLAIAIISRLATAIIFRLALAIANHGYSLRLTHVSRSSEILRDFLNLFRIIWQMNGRSRQNPAYRPSAL